MGLYRTLSLLTEHILSLTVPRFKEIMHQSSNQICIETQSRIYSNTISADRTHSISYSTASKKAYIAMHNTISADRLLQRNLTLPHASTHTHERARTDTHTHTHTLTHAHTHKHTYICVYMWVRVCVCVCVCMCVYMSLCVCVCVCAYVLLYRLAHRCDFTEHIHR